MHLRSLGLIAVVFCRVAAAQANFVDGFETGLVSPGQWDFIDQQNMNQGVNILGPGAKRGARGLIVVDSDADAGVGTQVLVGRNVTGSGSQYLRVWWRVPLTSSQPTALTVLNLQGTSNIGTLGELKWNAATHELRLTCFDRNSMFFGPQSIVPVVQDGGFHLIELAVRQVGTPAGLCSMAITGAEAARQQLDYSSLTFTNVLLGEAYGETSWTGVMHFDDFAASSSPIASRLKPPSAVSLGCNPIVFTPVDSFFSAPAPVPSTTVVSLRADGGSFRTGPSCAAPLTSVTMDAGASALTVFFQPDPAMTSVEVVASADDLVALRAIVPVVDRDGGVGADAGSADGGVVDGGGELDAGVGADAGVVDGGVAVDAGAPDAGAVSDGGAVEDAGIDGGARDGGSTADGGPVSVSLSVGCDCSSGGPGLVLMGLISLLVLRRRR